MADFAEKVKSEVEAAEVVKFVHSKHCDYIRKISVDTESFEYLVSQHLRMSGVYWGLTALVLLGVDIEAESFSLGMIDWIMSCFDEESGGFGGNTLHDSHLLYTLSAVQILALYNRLDIINREKVIGFIKSLQQVDGSFAGDRWGEIDTRFSYCALSALSILGALEEGHIDKAKAVQFIISCKNFDGGFGAVPGAESHAGQIFCFIGALSIAGGLEYVDVDLLGWWLSERQCDSGGLNGRPEKQADVCYSWWILSSLSILGRTSWIDCRKLADFIVNCQEKDEGGIADRPGNLPDVFHTFFGICGLLLLGHFQRNPIEGLNDIDPTYALPAAVVQRLGLYSQKLPIV